MDKKAAEAEAQVAKEATGRAMFEKGDWEASEGEESGGEDEDEGEDEEEDEDEAWNMEKLRQETEAMEEKREAERIAGYGQGAITNGDNGVLGHIEPELNGSGKGEENGEENGEAS